MRYITSKVACVACELLFNVYRNTIHWPSNLLCRPRPRFRAFRGLLVFAGSFTSRSHADHQACRDADGKTDESEQTGYRLRGKVELGLETAVGSRVRGKRGEKHEHGTSGDDYRSKLRIRTSDLGDACAEGLSRFRHDAGPGREERGTCARVARAGRERIALAEAAGTGRDRGRIGGAGGGQGD